MKTKPITEAASVHISRAAFHPHFMDWVVPKSVALALEDRVHELEDALAEIYHATDSTTGQMSIIESVLPQGAARPE